MKGSKHRTGYHSCIVGIAVGQQSAEHTLFSLDSWTLEEQSATQLMSRNRYPLVYKSSLIYLYIIVRGLYGDDNNVEFFL